MLLILCARGAFLTRRCKLDALFFSLQIIFMIMTNRTPTTSLFDFSDGPIIEGSQSGLNTVAL